MTRAGQGAVTARGGKGRRKEKAAPAKHSSGEAKDAGAKSGGMSRRLTPRPLPDDPDSGPDFLCVGAQKGGTRWLYDQLQLHPDFWMPPVKELTISTAGPRPPRR